MDENWTATLATIRLGLGALAVAAMASCQSYERRPLEPRLHRELWHARTLEDGSLSAFVDRLAERGDPRSVSFDPADGLTLAEGRLVALVFHPELRLARLRLNRATASAPHASRWADPELSVSALWITENVPSPWILTPSLTFTIPISGRLDAERSLADASRRVAQQAVLEEEWNLWSEVRRRWAGLSAAQLRVKETERLVHALDTLVQRTARLVTTGEILRTEAALFAIELARQRNLLRRAQQELREEQAGLRAMLGLSPEAPVEFVPTSFAFEPSRELEGSFATVAERSPRLALLRAEYAVSEETLRREIKKQIPDLTLGPQFESDEGQSRIGLIGGIPLPLINANTRAIVEARADREIARATFETGYELLAGRWASTRARVEAVAERRAELEAVLVPLIDRQIADALLLLELGEGTSLVLLESFRQAHEAKLELIETLLVEALARAELEHLTGPPDSKRAIAKKEATR